MKYYVPSVDNKFFTVYDKAGRKLERKPLKGLKRVEKVGLVCAGIAEGSSLMEVATGQGYRPKAQLFLLWVQIKPLYRKMYEEAKRRRVDCLQEKIVEAQNKGKGERVKVLREALKAFEDIPPPTIIRKNIIKKTDWLDKRFDPEAEETADKLF